MSLKRIALLCGVAPLGLVAMPAYAADQAATQAAETGAPSGDIIVTARRQNERLQDVPVAVSVVSPTVIANKGVFTPVDIAQSSPGLSVTASVSDRNNLTYTIRGQGFSYGTLFPAVVTYFNEVPIAQLTTGQFFDIADVQVLRGPQGVSFGRVTDGGNVMVNAQTPKNEFGGNFYFKLGNYNLRTLGGAINIPIVPDKILLRAATEISRRDGFTKNVETGQDLDNIRYEGYRVGLTLKPTDTLTNTTVASYLRTHNSGTSVVLSGINSDVINSELGDLAAGFGFAYAIAPDGNVVPAGTPGSVPFTAANYVASQQAQLAAQQARGPRKVAYTAPSFDRRKNIYIVNTTTADLTDSIQLKNVFGYVNEKDFEASNFSASNGNLILTCHSACQGFGAGTDQNIPFAWQQQLSEELRLSGKSFDNMLTWAIGGYMDKQKPGGTSENDTINVAVLERTNVQKATTTSKAVYASGEYDLQNVLPGLKINGGVRYTHDTVNSFNATYLRPIYFPASEVFPAIPHGECTDFAYDTYPFGKVSCANFKASFNAVTWTGGVSYKPSRAVLLYAKVSKGYRPGGVNASAPNNTDARYNPEYDLSVEVGVKGDFSLGGDARLRTNIAAYHDKYTKILKNVTIAGANGVPLSLEENVDDGTIQGVELEATVIPVRGLSFGGTFAYTDAKFSKSITKDADYDPNSCNPLAPAPIFGFCPYNRFNSVPKTQFTLSADYTLPLDPSIGQISIGGRYYHQSSVALTDTSRLAVNAIEPGYGTLDLNVNWANVFGNPMDLGFFITNVTDKLYRIGSNDLSYNSSVGVRGDIYAAPRMFGFSLKYRFGSDANGG